MNETGKKTLDTMTKQQLKEEYHLTASFIARHAKEMGGIGKPMIFDRELVELFLRERFWKDRIAKEWDQERAHDAVRFVRERVHRLKEVVPSGPGQIHGMGGRLRKAVSNE